MGKPFYVICKQGRFRSYTLVVGCQESIIPGAEVIKLFSCSTQLSMKSKMLINIEIAKIYGFFRFNLLKPTIYPANKC